MAFENSQVVSRRTESALATNAVLRNTYLLLGLTTLFSAATAGVAMITNAPPVGLLGLLVGYFGLYFLTMYLRNSAWGLVSIFAFTGFLGYILGPMLNVYIRTLSNGSELIMMSLGATGLIFFALSAYALTTRKDFSFLGGFLTVGLLVFMFVGLGAIFFKMTMLSLAVSAVFIFLYSGVILYQTSQIVNSGETNYILATITLYVSVFSIFVNLLQLLGVFGGNRD